MLSDVIRFQTGTWSRVGLGRARLILRDLISEVSQNDAWRTLSALKTN